jgi:RNA polymerase sigma factor (sigma-70 family)
METDDLAGLVARMSRGDERALEQLYEATVGKLYALAASILRRIEDAEEVVCATYTHAWANAASYNVDRGSVLGWLLMLCRSRALDRLRQLRLAGIEVDISVLAHMHAEDAQPDDLISSMQQQGRVRAALAKLDPDRRQLISLAFFTGMSHQDIAETTGMPLGTVKSHVRRALVQLRDELESQ